MHQYILEAMLPDPFRPVDYPSSSATSPASMPRPPKPLRLRLACDACTAAKVKCGKTHPCERCIDNGQECFYSASRRHGKRSRHRNTESGALCSPPSSGAATPAAAAASAATASTISDCSELIWGDNEGGLRATFTLGDSRDNLDGWAPHDMDMTFHLDDTGCISLAEPWKSLESMIPNQSELQLSDIMPPPSKTVPAERPASLDKASVAAITSQSSDSHHARLAHDCEALALRVLHSLHHNAAGGQTAFSYKGPHDAAAGTALAKTASQMPSVDTVLFANQAALTNLTPLLKCPCARSPHIALLHITILSKAIFWYRVAVTARHAADGAGLRPMKIELGMLDLDDDDQETLQRAVLLRELRKAERVIETFDTCSTGEGEAPTWHGLTIRKMRDELKAIVHEIRRGQSDWP